MENYTRKRKDSHHPGGVSLWVPLLIVTLDSDCLGSDEELDVSQKLLHVPF